MLNRIRKSKPLCLASIAKNRKFPSASGQLESNPWDNAAAKYTVGSHVKGQVRNLTSYGAFVELEEGIDGMIHVSDMSWTRKINHPSEVMKKGDVVEATVLEVDRPNQRIALGMKTTRHRSVVKYRDALQSRRSRHRQSHEARELWRIRRLATRIIDGLVHISQITEDRVDKIKNVLKVGQDVSARVIKIDKGERRNRPVHQSRQL